MLSRLNNNEAKIHVPIILHKVIQRMQKNLSEPLKLEELAFSAGISPRTLSRMFVKYFQITPHKYLIRLPMQRACQMLTWEEFSIKETAFAVGYPNALNFSTEFRRIIGCSPSQYRLQGNMNHPDMIPDSLPEVSAAGEEEVI